MAGLRLLSRSLASLRLLRSTPALHQPLLQSQRRAPTALALRALSVADEPSSMPRALPRSTRPAAFTSVLSAPVGRHVSSIGMATSRSFSKATAAKAARGRRRGGEAASGDGPEDEEERKRRKLEGLADVIRRINEELGAGTVLPLSASGQLPDVEVFSTGILPLDLALGGGWPKGRLVEIYGHESSGKTSIALYAMAEVQKLGHTVVLIDAEHAMDMQYAKKLGVVTEGPEKMIVQQPSSGEEAINVIDFFIRSGHVSLVVVDSVSALVPQAELESSFGEGSLGQLARLMSASLRRLAPMAAKSGCTIIFLNQIRNKIGGYGNPEVTTGGLALKFHASVRCQITTPERYKVGKQETGIRARVKVVKSKVGIPYKTAEFDLMFGKGIVKEGALLDVAESLGVVARKGAYYYIGGVVNQGREKTVAYLQDNPDVCAQLEKTVKDSIREGKSMEAVAASSAEEEEEELYLGEEEALEESDMK